MKTAVTSEDGDGHSVYNGHSWRSHNITASIRGPAGRTAPRPRARSSRSATSGRTSSSRAASATSTISRPIDDWLATVANVRATAPRRKSSLRRLPPRGPSCRRCQQDRSARCSNSSAVSATTLVSIGGNYCSVPDRTRRIVEVQQLPDLIRILGQGEIVAVHPVLEGRQRTRVAPEHRQSVNQSRLRPGVSEALVGRAGDHLPRGSLEVYQAVGKRLAQSGGRP